MRWAVVIGAVVGGVAALGEARAQEEPAPEPAPQPSPKAGPPAPQPGYGYPPWGYGYGYGYGYTYQPPQPPKRLPYQEGQAPPYGYHFDTQLRKGLIIGGATTFGATYLLSVAVGAAFQDDNDAERFAPLFVPVVGPFISMGTADPTAFATFILVLDGLAQTLGVGMFIAGVTDREKVWVRNDMTIDVRPLVGPGVAGLALAGDL